MPSDALRKIPVRLKSYCGKKHIFEKCKNNKISHEQYSTDALPVRLKSYCGKKKYF